MSMLIPAKELNPETVERWLTFPNGNQLSVRVLSKLDEMAEGMRGKESFDPYDGLLFVHPFEGRYTYTMEGVPVPLDILFLDSSGRIVSISEMTPGGYSVSNAYPARFVLELPAGTAQRENLKVFRSQIRGVSQCA